MTYEELANLVYDILEVIDCELNLLGIYDFINIFIFDLNKRIKIISQDNIFINCINKNVIYYGYWKNDVQFGIGYEIWDDSSCYYGEYNEGKKEGIGMYIWQDDRYHCSGCD